ncbi:DUF4189 domain-containing protein [Solitalea canadensis]|uniref:DUF4189 domain-containing protein n=1 Tax=Solitalea canadensis (strain ATCC 29591 / DSM 3403 / JCM 21819 / LMG 8368 / NBRC 15130 / NCIMB 12057 / USAM 9D) TaxID=929556 RepID=H8KVT3_SOLCM|nr:DUF4189 domain-containing protein [Solitalea canadensis]AFD06706.1 hypothetical protein Solca_1639 [Solitalea canadensis DSM 3403]
MRKLLLTLMLIICATILVKAQTTKYGALAIDRDNGFYYGWAYDYSTVEEAEKRAIEECTRRGGNAYVVLTWSGGACAAYRTIDGKVGTAYGWGVAPTRVEADAIATRECLKRSNGSPASNFVWACNSSNAPFKEIYNAANQNPAPTTSTQNTGAKDFISFNGGRLEASGDCPSENTASITTDDESFGVLISNLPVGGSANVAAPGTCSDCTNLILTDLNNTKSYIATRGSVTRNGKGVTFNVSVMEMNDMLNGGGTSYSLSGTITCED